MNTILKKSLLLLFLSINFLGLNNVNADSDINFSTCQLNNAYCNVANPDIDNITKNKIDKILSQFYLKMDNKYHSYKDTRYIYYNLMEKVKDIAKKGDIYDSKYKILYYIYYNVESEYYKANNALVQSSIQQANNDVNNFLTSINEKENIKPEKNTINDSFSKAKRVLQGYAYNGKGLPRKTIYCGCNFNDKKEVNKDSCGYQNKIRITTDKNGNITSTKELYKTRSNKIEWEHVVPAENFGNSFIEWREGDPKCIDSKGKSFKGRKCAEKVNKEYRYMQADIYNLYPAVGSLNAFRSNYQIAEISGEKRDFGKCDFEIDSRKMEPPNNMKGDIARVYEYMNKTYPGKGIIGDKTQKLINVWKNIDPISKEECDRYHALKKIQKNINIVLEEPCKLVK